MGGLLGDSHVVLTGVTWLCFLELLVFQEGLSRLVLMAEAGGKGE